MQLKIQVSCRKSQCQALCQWVIDKVRIESCSERKSQRMKLAQVQVRLVSLSDLPKWSQFTCSGYSILGLFHHQQWSKLLLDNKRKFLSLLFKTFFIGWLSLFNLLDFLSAKCKSVFLNYSIFCSSVISKPLTYMFNKNVEFFPLIL